MVRLLFGSCLATVVLSIKVNINSGDIVGHSILNVDSFPGIPYAQPPLNDLRFRAPQALNTSLGTFKCPKTPPACLQTPSNPTKVNAATATIPKLHQPAFIPIQKETEDCLTLDIVRPASNDVAASRKLLPVLFWIHGGGFMNGATQLYPGEKIVNFSIEMGEPILFVAPNYRLGLFGFMPGNEIKAEGSSNAGLKDQRLALQWVQDNIAQFGGDPNRVTIVGESAGSHSVMYQTIINRGNNLYNGRPLFRGAIQSSGSIYPLQDIGSPTAQDVFNRVVDATECRNFTFPLSCLRGLDATILNAASTANPVLPNYLSLRTSYKPRPDDQDDFLPHSSEVAFAGRAFSNVSYILGNMQDEATYFVSSSDNLTTLDQMTDYLVSSYPDASRTAISGLVDTYDNRPGSGSPFNTGSSWQLYPVFKQLAAIYGDLYFQFPRRRQLELISSSVPSWSFQMAAYPEIDWFGTCHGSDLYGLFANFTWNQFAEDSLSRHYINFVSFLDPNGNTTYDTAASINGSIAMWPQYSEKNPSILQYLPTLNQVTVDTFRGFSYNYWLSIYTALRY